MMKVLLLATLFSFQKFRMSINKKPLTDRRGFLLVLI